MDVRDERRADTSAIRWITDAAFAEAEHRSGTEGAIVDALRAAGALTISLVAEENGEVEGHVAFSPVAVAGKECGWFGLGPVAVRPGQQGKGLGGALIRAGLDRLRTQGAGGCVVLGDPGYYRRFGFTHAPGLLFEGAPPEYFMCLAFDGSAPAGVVTYHPAFGV